MSSTETIRGLVGVIVRDNARYDGVEGVYELAVEDVSKHDVLMYAALKMQEDEDWAYDCMGVDNNSWVVWVVPRLIRFLMQPDDDIEQDNLLSSIEGAVFDYFVSSLHKDLDEECAERTRLKRIGEM